MKSNFDFLNRYWPALAQIGATAETYVYSDPNACIYKLGMFAERLVQEILVFEHIAEPAVDNTHANRIRILKRAGLLPHEIDNTLYVLRKTRKFGLNNMNSYFQNANTETAVVWRDWKYKVGDHILFNDTDRFSLLYNNLKGRIVQIELFDSRIRFTVDVEIPLTEQDCQNDGIEFIDIIDDVTRIRFDVFDFEEEMADEDRKKTIVPFQLAYAVSIHKAQGLEYRSVKVVIPSSNAEKITHGIFYTAITRAKEKLKIYWSSETMQEVVAGFSIDTSRQKSLAIIKEKLKQDKNT